MNETGEGEEEGTNVPVTNGTSVGGRPMRSSGTPYCSTLSSYTVDTLQTVAGTPPIFRTCNKRIDECRLVNRLCGTSCASRRTPSTAYPLCGGER